MEIRSRGARFAGGTTPLVTHDEAGGREIVAAELARAQAVADSVLYEGYLLYPYRRSAPKNQLRWQFGVLAPASWVNANVPEDHGISGAIESSYQQTECLLQSPPDCSLQLRIRFLRVVRRQPELLHDNGDFTPVDVLGDGDDQQVAFEEAMPEGECITLPLADIREGAFRKELSFPPWETTEVVLRDGNSVGRIDRRAEGLSATVVLSVQDVDAQHSLRRLRVRVDNLVSEFPATGQRSQALRHSFIATHVLMGVDAGGFVSLLDPPAWGAEAAAACDNIHTFPVLMGIRSPAPVVLSAPIILYDGVTVAAESPGDLHDAAEIDEILSLRTMTLTDAEKAEARRTDPRAAAIVDRVDGMPPEVWQRLHGALRGLGPVDRPGLPEGLPWWEPGGEAEIDPERDTVQIDGVSIGRGRRVRLRPRGRGADAYDIFLAGQIATVARVLTDVDGSRFVAVTVGGDPAGGIEEWYGRTFHFRPDELVPLATSVLVAGIGNIFLGDDGFGVAVISALNRMALPDGATAVDYGIRGVHLAYELLDGRYDTLVLVDAVPMGEPPGTLAVLRIDEQDGGDQNAGPGLDAHAMNPEAVLGALRSLGGSVDRVYVVGCQPGVLEPEMQLTNEVAAAVSPAARMVTDLLADLIGRPAGVTSDA